MTWYDKEGKPIEDIRVWGRLAGDPKYWRVAEDTVGDVWISTVWVGSDMRWTIAGPPMIFETMAFSPDGGDLACERYATLEEAQRGHERVVERVRKGEIS